MQFIDSSSSETHDDILFLVLIEPRKEGPYLVRRREKSGMQADIIYGGELYSKIDWRSSFCLNIVMQSQYSLTVAVCSYATPHK